MSHCLLPLGSKFFQLTTLSVALVLAGCGGGDGTDTIAPVPDTGLVQVTDPVDPTDPNQSPDTSQASEIYLLSNYSGIKMTQGSTINITALVLDDKNGVLGGQPVTFKITDPEATGVFSNSPSEIVTDENGKADIQLEVEGVLTTQQRNYLLNNGLVIEASIGNITKSITLYGATGNTDLEKQDVYDVFISSEENKLLTGEDQTSINIRVTDKNGGIVAGVPVIISIADAAAYGLSLDSASKQITDSEGLVTVELVQSRVSTDAQLNHESVLTVIVDDEKNSIVEQSIPIIVSGTETEDVSSTQNTVTVGESFSVSGRVIDGALKPVSNAKVVLYSNNVEAGVGETDIDGNFVFDLNSANLSVSSDNNYLFSIEVSGNQIEQRIPDILTIASVNSSNMSFSQPNDIITGQREKILLTVPNANDGDFVAISTNKGKIFASTTEAQGSSRRLLPVVNGMVEFYIESDVLGIVSITAEYGQDQKSTLLNIVSIDPRKLLVQTKRSVLTTGGSTKVMAKVLDNNDAPVKNAIVQFTTTKDSSGGRLDRSIAYTNNDGEAEVTYAAGNNPTSTDGVVIEAQVQSIKLPNGQEKAVNSISNTTKITVQTVSSFISFAFADKVSPGPNDVYYYRKGSISVLNSTGKPARQQAVSINIRSEDYFKGYYTIIRPILDAPYWEQQAVLCKNEDTNNNGILDPNEDFNGNGQLDPINIAAVINDSGQEVDSTQNFNFVTDDSGKIDFSIRYPKQYSDWYRAKVTVNTRVDGSESQQSRVIDFPALANDIDISVPIRPNYNSPFGKALSCSSPD